MSRPTNTFTFNFKFKEVGQNICEHSFHVTASNLKGAVTIWTNYVQSGSALIELISVEKNGERIKG